MRALLLLSVAMLCRAQNAELVAAAKSPVTLARYVESHPNFGWDELWAAVGTADPHIDFVPCGKGELNTCTTELISVSNPDQSILILRNHMPQASDIYLRFRRMTNGSWSFAGEQTIGINNDLREHEVLRIWNKPILKVSSDQSQAGFAIEDVEQERFDLSQPDFEPIFSLSEGGGSHPFGFGVGWEFDAKFATRQTPGREIIDVTLNVLFTEEGPNPEAIYRGVYERRGSEKTFTLRSASVPVDDFKKLADPFNGPSNEKLLVYGLAGLLKIARGSDMDKKEWLESVLEHTKDTSEKRQLLEALRMRN
jgi:hypothetical protein